MVQLYSCVLFYTTFLEIGFQNVISVAVHTDVCLFIRELMVRLLSNIETSRQMVYIDVRVLP